MHLMIGISSPQTGVQILVAAIRSAIAKTNLWMEILVLEGFKAEKKLKIQVRLGADNRQSPSCRRLDFLLSLLLRVAQIGRFGFTVKLLQIDSFFPLLIFKQLHPHLHAFHLLDQLG